MEENALKEDLEMHRQIQDLKNELSQLRTQFSSIVKSTIKKYLRNLQQELEAQDIENTIVKCEPSESEICSITSESPYGNDNKVFHRRSKRCNTTADSFLVKKRETKPVTKKNVVVDKVTVNPPILSVEATPVLAKKKQKRNKTRLSYRLHKPNKVQYNCNICAEIFLLLRQVINHCEDEHNAVNVVKDHAKWYHRSAQKFTCEICSKEFSSNKTCVRHVKDCHKLTGYNFHCENCTETFAEKKELEKHSAIAHSRKSGNQNYLVVSRPEKGIEKKYKCTYENCCKAFTIKTTLQLHMDEHLGRFNHSCTHCDAKFVQKSQLNKHLKKIHNISIKAKFAPIPSTCTVCERHFKSLKALSDHYSVAHPEITTFDCTECKEKWKTYLKLIVHKNNCHAPKTFVCKVCGKGFSSNSKLVYHSAIHMEDKPWKCSVCSKGFASRTVLIYHERSHRGERPLKCDLCDKTYSQPSALYLHKKTHSGVKDFLCDQCEKTFYTLATLRAHQKLHEKVYSCGICGKVSANAADLQKHNLVHTGERPHMCEVCGSGYTQLGPLKKHMKDKHGIKTSGPGRRRIFIPGLPPLQTPIKPQLIVENPALPSITTPPVDKEPISITDLADAVTNIFHQEQNSVSQEKPASEEMEETTDDICDFDNFDDPFSPEGNLNDDFVEQDDEPSKQKIPKADAIFKVNASIDDSVTHQTVADEETTKRLNCFKESDGTATSASSIKEKTENSLYKDEIDTSSCDWKQQIKNRQLVIKLEKLLVYPCEICKCAFITEKEQTQHLKTRQHRFNKKSSNQTVDENPPSEQKTELEIRLSKIREGGKPYQCDLNCPKTFTRWGKLVAHYNLHKSRIENPESEIKYKCRVCDEVFQLKDSLLKHEKIHPEAHFFCMICTKSFSSTRGLDNHMKRHRNERPYKCDECENTYSEYSHWKRHKTTKHGHGPILKVCVCGKEFRDMSYYRNHYKTHVKDPETTSAADDRTFLPTGVPLPRSKSNKIGERPWICEVCGRGFKAKVTMAEHIKYVHTIEAMFSCELCGKTCKRRKDFMRHIRLHSEDKPYKCHLCVASYVSSDSLLKHIRDHGSGTGDAVCSICHGRFDTISKLRWHERLVHPKPKGLVGKRKRKKRSAKNKTETSLAVAETLTIAAIPSTSEIFETSDTVIRNTSSQQAPETAQFYNQAFDIPFPFNNDTFHANQFL